MKFINSDRHIDGLPVASLFKIDGDGRDDTLYGDYDYNIIDGKDGNDKLYGFGGDDVLIGGYGNDTLYGGDGNDLLVGDNTVDGRGGNDTLYGGEGNDRLYGGYGNDVYIYTANTGMDTINDGRTAAEYPGYGGGVDVLLFNGANLSDIHTFRLVGSNDLLIYSSAGIVGGVLQHGVTIQDFYSNNQNTNIEYLQDGKGNYASLSALLASDEASHSEPPSFDPMA
ncbi:calcium-binding protein [Achromobacter anxifer]